MEELDWPKGGTGKTEHKQANIQITITRMEAAFKGEIGGMREPASGFQQECRME
jgi:hypothetical protein